MVEISSSNLFLAMLLGVIPAVLWLLFWLMEDYKRPEPRGLLLLTFLGGMISVAIAIPFGKIAYENLVRWTPLLFLVLAFGEEIIKYGAAYFTSLKRKEMDEPIDPIIYMLTAALGFAAVENTLFIISPLIIQDGIAGGLIVGNLRFIGASLLHTVSSAAIGVAMALSFYKSKKMKRLYLFLGIIVAIALHTSFNLFIIRDSSSSILAGFGFVWLSIIILMLIFEKVKRIQPIK